MEHHDRNRTKKSIDELQARGDHFTRILIKEKQRTATLQAKLNEVNDKIASLRDSNKQKATSLLNNNTITPNNACATIADENQKKIVKKLESRLGKTLLRRSEVENENDAIKGKIDKLRWKVYNDSKSKECLEKELVCVNDDVDKIMKRAAAVAAERERLIERRNQVLQQDNEKQAVFEIKYNELCLFIADQAKSIEESIVKAADSVMAQLSIVGGGQGLNSTSVSDSVDDIKHLEDRVVALDIEYESTQNGLRDNQLKIHHFEEKFKELREVSGLSSTDDIITTFVKSEDECFSVFNYIQTVNHDCDRTIEQTAQLREDINKYRQKQIEEESARSATMNVFKESLQEVELVREKLCETAIEGRRTIEIIAHRVTALYFKLKCNELKGDEPASKDTLSIQLQNDRKLTTIGGGEVSQRNILNLMELIETRSIQIVEEFQNQMDASKRTSRRSSSILVSHACHYLFKVKKK